MHPPPRLTHCSAALLLAALMLAPIARPAAAAEAERVAAADPMAHLKARLQEKLGASRIEEQAAGTHELQVSSRAQPAPVARPRPRAPARDAAASSWSYHGAARPERWAELDPDFSLCASGQRQSPIDIRDGIAVELEPIRFDYRVSGFAVVDTGRTVRAQVAGGNTIEVMGRRYELQHIQFHRPSQERIDGRQFEMSVHLVHRDPEGRQAVVAVVLERGAAQPAVQQVWNNLPLEKHEPLAAFEPLDPAALLPSDRRYYTYMGSLTTPPCTEGVLWMVMQQPVQASGDQIHIFSRLYPNNARPVQQTAGRLIKQSL